MIYFQYYIMPLLIALLTCFILPVFIKLVVAFIMGYKDKLSLLGIIFVNLITIPLLLITTGICNYILLSLLNLVLQGYYENMYIFAIGEFILLCIVFMVIEWLLLIYTLGGKKKKLLIMAIVMNISAYATVIFGSWLMEWVFFGHSSILH